MRSWSPERIAVAAGARLIVPAPARHGPDRVTIDSRDAGPGALFVGLRGARTDGGRFAAQALDAGAWGVLTTAEYADTLRPARGVVLVSEQPLTALARLANAWRRELDAKVIGITGSTGKTSTKDLLLALLAAHRKTIASRANFNTEVGLPLEILAAPAGTEVLVLEMGMRGAGQIAELAAISEPDVAVIVSVGPVHLELLGTIEAVAAAKAELIAGLPRGGVAVVPVAEPLLAPHLREDVELVTFGAGGDVHLIEARGGVLEIDLAGQRITLEVPFTQAHLRTDLLAAAAAAAAVGVLPHGRVEVELSPGRGQRLSFEEGVVVIDDCYNANPMSMRAALEDLAAIAAREDHPRRVAVLGDMLELGPGERDYHLELGDRARAQGVDILITVGDLAAAIAERFDGECHVLSDAGEAAAALPELLAPGDVVLVKGSRGVGLELVVEALSADQRSPAPPPSTGSPS